MNDNALSLVAVSEHRIPTERGWLWARQWQPNQPSADAPIILLHDSLGCVDLWRDFPARLAAGTGRVVWAYDRYGFGRSSPLLAPLPLDFIEQEARGGFADLRRELGVQDFVVLGHSVGGGMAVHCAAAWPAHCAALITLSAQAFNSDQTRAGIRIAQREFAQPAQWQRLEKYHGDKAGWVLSAWTESWLHSDFTDWSLAGTQPGVRCPTLVLHGEADEYGDAAQAEALGRLCQGKVVLLPGIGHVPHRECPERIVAQVQAFLTDITRLPQIKPV